MKRHIIDKGNIPKVWELMVYLHETNPLAFKSPATLEYFAKQKWTSLNDKGHCPNCNASMKGYRYWIDPLDCNMLIEMANHIKRNTGPTFKDVNQVHVHVMEGPTYAMKSRTSKLAKLGLVAKVIGEKGIQKKGTWLITKRGWHALRGGEIPKYVDVWRNTIMDRAADHEVTTIKQVYDEHLKVVREKELFGKKFKGDFRLQAESYIPSQWVDYTDNFQGSFF